MSDNRTPAQFFFEIGFMACWAEARARGGAFRLTDAMVERAWEIAPEAHPDPEEWARYLAAANAQGVTP